MHTLEELNQKFNTYLSRFKYIQEPEGLYIPFEYIMKIGGKRLRPLLCLLSCELFGRDAEEAMAAAMSLEVFHNFTLVHDDIMDEANMRRGAATVHKKYGLNSAILSGDLMLIRSYELLEYYKEPLIFRALMSTFNKSAREVCEGQQWDIDFESRNDVTLDEYLKMIGLKTGVLIAGALKMGAIVGGADVNSQDHLYKFGYNLGIGFQLQDDLLDTFGEEHVVGKKIGGDILQNKKTYLYLKALELADEKQKEELISIYNNKLVLEDSDKIEKITQLFKRLVVEEYARQVRDAYLDLAYAHLAAVNVPNNQKTILNALAKKLVNRSY